MPVSEVALAKELGSSRTPIREAISQLVSEHLLDHTPNRGTVVVRLSRQDVIDLYELREALETFAAEKTARQPVSQSDLDRLRSLAHENYIQRDRLIASGREYLSPEEMHQFTSSDLGFHVLLMRLAANPRILRVVKETRLLIRIFAMRRRGHSVEELDRIYRHHCEIIAALAAGEATRVRQVVSDHIRISQRESLDEFDEWEREEALIETSNSFSGFPEPTNVRR